MNIRDINIVKKEQATIVTEKLENIRSLFGDPGAEVFKAGTHFASAVATHAAIIDLLIRSEAPLGVQLKVAFILAAQKELLISLTASVGALACSKHVAMTEEKVGELMDMGLCAHTDATNAMDKAAGKAEAAKANGGNPNAQPPSA